MRDEFLAEWWKGVRNCWDEDECPSWPVVETHILALFDTLRSEPVAWMHTLHMENGETTVSVDLEEEHPYGEPGYDYHPSFSVTSQRLYTSPQPQPRAATEQMKAEALRLLKGHDERDDKVQQIIEDLREIILLMPAASRPEGLMEQAQAAVYAMRGRTRLMDDAAITGPLVAAACEMPREP